MADDLFVISLGLAATPLWMPAAMFAGALGGIAVLVWGER